MQEWWKSVKRIAFGALSLHPREFYELSPLDLYDMAEGYEWRQKHEDERKAYWVANLMNCQLQKSITPSDLLAPLYDEPTAVKSEEEFFAQFEEVLNDGNNC